MFDISGTLWKYGYAVKHGGYNEASGRSWQEMDGIRVSAKDANERKSMVTQPAPAGRLSKLYRIWPDEDVKERLLELIG